MSNGLNILILSCGTRNKIVQYFKRELNGKGNVIATDCSRLAPALYEADKYYIVPQIDDKHYIDTIFEICKKEEVSGVLSLIDPELSLVTKNRALFESIGCKLIMSDYEITEMCFDKMKMYNFLKENDFNAAKSYIDKDVFLQDVEKGIINFPVFVKPVKGSASIHINKAINNKQLDVLFDLYDDLLIQEFLNGTEYGADVYIDMISGETVSIFVKEKIKMRAGETDKAVSVKDENLFNLIKRFVKRAGFKGIIDIDIFKVECEYYISEVNPRFGGGYPHAYECNVNVPEMIIKNIRGIANEDIIGRYNDGVYMMKYNEVKIIRE